MIRGDLARISSPFNGLFEMFNNFDELPFSKTPHALKADLVETDSDYIIKFDVPGRTKNELDICFENNVLTVSVQSQGENTEESGRYRLRERRYEQLSRSFHLPDVDAETVEAKVDNGVLSVVAQKHKGARTRKIPVK